MLTHTMLILECKFTYVHLWMLKRVEVNSSVRVFKSCLDGISVHS